MMKRHIWSDCLAPLFYADEKTLLKGLFSSSVLSDEKTLMKWLLSSSILSDEKTHMMIV